MIKIFAYAKINLFLDIRGKRADGYHDIVSVMQTVDWHDILYIDEISGRNIEFHCAETEIPTDERNTVYKAAKLFLNQTGIQKGIKIELQKHIPHEAGMAGGSADAAATLRGLNSLFGNPLPNDELLSLGLKIGADVPFCMTGGTKLVEGIGEHIKEFPSLPSLPLVCAKRGRGVSTPAAYRALDDAYCNFLDYSPNVNKLELLRNGFQSGSVNPKGMYNIFESVVEPDYPSVPEIKEEMIKGNALTTLMSGSGPSVFGVFENLADAEKTAKALEASGTVCRVCFPISDPLS